MTVSISALKPGDVVYDARMVRTGNSNIRRLSVWTVLIKEVDVEGSKVVAAWNGNQDLTFRARNGKLPWRRTRPEKN